MKRKYGVAKYIRLSIADGDNRESESVENQRDLLNNYISNTEEFSENYEYVDDGYSGGNFNRPAFKKMLEDIDNGKINCIITKDLSRFGREHIETGYYLEKYFPLKDVRFVAINDFVDTIDDRGLEFLSFKLSFNDYYIQDISDKVKSVKKKKMLLGELTGGSATYGYNRSTQVKNHIVIDKKVEHIVRYIFEMYGYKKMSSIEIAADLTNKKILTPRAYINRKLGKEDNNTVWQRATIMHILKNKAYIGCMVGGKKERINPKLKKDRRVSKDKQIVVENSHEPIISMELWDLVQERIKSLTHDNQKKHEYVLKSLVFCGECGSRGNFSYNKHMVNGEAKRQCIQVTCNRKIKGCNSKRTNENTLLQAVNFAIRSELEQVKYTNKELKQKLEKIQNDKFKGNNEMNLYLKKLERIKNQISKIYKDKLERIISTELFQKEYEILIEEKKNIEERINELMMTNLDIEEKINKNKELIKIAKNYLKMEKTDNETLKALVKKVIFYDEKITVELKFEKVS